MGLCTKIKRGFFSGEDEYSWMWNKKLSLGYERKESNKSLGGLENKTQRALITTSICRCPYISKHVFVRKSSTQLDTHFMKPFDWLIQRNWFYSSPNWVAHWHEKSTRQRRPPPLSACGRPGIYWHCVSCPSSGVYWQRLTLTSLRGWRPLCLFCAETSTRHQKAR